MTENQEKELFNTLGKLVTGVQQVQQTLDEHTAILSEHSSKLNEHSAMLKTIDSKVEGIGRQVMENDKRLTARISSVENAVENIGGQTH